MVVHNWRCYDVITIIIIIIIIINVRISVCGDVVTEY